MIYFTELRQATVYDSAGSRVGRIADLALVPAQDARRVGQFVLKSRSRRFAVSYREVGDISLQAIRLKIEAGKLNPYAPGDDELLIGKDVLDQQIIDINGRKVVRVNDLGFVEHKVNGTCEVRVSEVDVGISGAFRRLLEGLLPARFIRKLESAFSRTVIPWEFVDLIETDPQRRVKLKIAHEKLAKLHPADLADIVEELAPAEREAIFETLDESKAADALSEVEPKVQKSIIEALDSERAADILEEMAPDEAADLLAELPEHTSEEILDDMQPAEAEEVEELLEFEEDTAGGMMNTEFIAVPDGGTIQSAIDALRANREVASSCNTIFLLDAQGRLSGAVPLAELFLSPPSTPLPEIKAQLLLFVHVDDPERLAFSLFDKYNVFTLPVVDTDYQLAGVITADDIISRLKAKM